jgi:hypothetical protein
MLAIVADREHARLCADVAEVGAVETVRELDHRLVVDLALLVDRPGMDLEDLESRLLVRERDLNLPVEPARPKEGRVERVGPVGCHDDLGLAERVETVHLIEQL